MWGTFSATAEIHTVCHSVCILQKIKIKTKKLFTILGFILCGRLRMLYRRYAAEYSYCIRSVFSLTFRHRVPCILGQAFRYSPENACYIFNQQIYFII